MAANVTLNGDQEFAVDAVQGTATQASPGGNLYCTGPIDAIVNINGGTVITTQPSGPDCLRVPKGNLYPIPLPVGCSKFTFAATGLTYLQYVTRT